MWRCCRDKSTTSRSCVWWSTPWCASSCTAWHNIMSSGSAAVGLQLWALLSTRHPTDTLWALGVWAARTLVTSSAWTRACCDVALHAPHRLEVLARVVDAALRTSASRCGCPAWLPGWLRSVSVASLPVAIALEEMQVAWVTLGFFPGPTVRVLACDKGGGGRLGCPQCDAIFAHKATWAAHCAAHAAAATEKALLCSQRPSQLRAAVLRRDMDAAVTHVTTHGRELASASPLPAGATCPATKACSVCGDVMRFEFDDATNDWVWWGVVRHPVTNALCHTGCST